MERFLKRQQNQLFSYAEVGSTRGPAPPGYNVEYQTADGSVWYDLFAFSRPRHILATWDIRSAAGCNGDSPEIR